MRCSPVVVRVLTLRVELYRFPVSAVTMLVTAVLLSAGLPIRTAEAQIIDWKTPGSSGLDPLFSFGPNWDGGSAPGSTATARFNHAATFEVWFDSSTAVITPSVGFLQVLQGNVTFLNVAGNAQHELTINGSGGAGSFSDFTVSGAGTSLTNSGIHLHSLGGGQITEGATLTLDGSHLRGAQVTVDGSIGFDVSGNLNVYFGAIFGNTQGYIGRLAGATGAATVTGSGSQWNNSLNLFVSDGGNGTLNVEAGGLVSNVTGFIGASAGSSGVATVTGTTVTGDGSQWNNSVDLYVGLEGNGTLNVNAGGLVSNSNGYVGRSSGSTGVATVTGVGSKWNSSGGLYLGGTNTIDGGVGTLNINSGGQVNAGNDFYTGAGTALTVSDSGANGMLYVRHGSIINNSGVGYIGLNNGSTGVATVTGVGSKWRNFGGLYLGGNATTDGGVGTLNINASSQVNVGNAAFIGLGTVITVSDFGPNGTLYVRHGSTITNDGFGYIGHHSASTGVATVTGSDSQWNNSGALTVGDFGNGMLNVQAGGLVSNSDGYIGYSFGSTGAATVTGSGSRWNNSGALSVGVIGNGTLNVEAGGLVSNTSGTIGNSSGSTGDATVTGSDSQWNNSGALNVGDIGNGTLNVEAGGLVSNTSGTIGNSSGSTGDATVTGSDSQWNNSSMLSVGYAGNGTLNVEAGAQVSNSVGTIGRSSGSTGVVTVTGSNSQWNNISALNVGENGNGTLNVEAGGLVSNSLGFIGRNAGSMGVATVTGSDSQWNNSFDLYVGYGGNGTLNVEDGGLVSNTSGAIGNSAGSTGVATVTGSGSQWNNSSVLSVGYLGSGTLNVEAGGLVGNGNGYIGRFAGSIGTATVSGVGSRWNSSGGLYLGGNATSDGGAGTLVITGAGQVNVGSDHYGGAGTALTVSDSGANGKLFVRNGSTIDNAGLGMIGYNSGATGAATVTGSGSKWNNSGGLYLGGTATTDGGMGSLTIANGGQVHVGNNPYTGADMVLTVSDTGSNGKLFVRNGSTIDNDGVGLIGWNSGSTGVATVTGGGSQWNNAAFTTVGQRGNGSLNVEAGGQVNNSLDGYVGRLAGGVGTATVTGTGSTWNNKTDLYLGSSWTINGPVDGGVGSLTISAGGHVNVGDDLYGGPVAAMTVSDSVANGNLHVRNGSTISNFGLGIIGNSFFKSGTATVAGSGSQWNNSSHLYVGDSGNGTLNVQAGGLVSNLQGFIGRNADSTSVVTVTGGGSQWNSSSVMYVGFNGNGTLIIQDGGLVTSSFGGMGRFSGSSGVVNVSGVGSQWINAGQQYVGVGGAGTLNIEAGGLVSDTDGYIGQLAGSTGIATVTGSGSQWNNSGGLYIGGSSAAAGGMGTINVDTGGTVRVGGELKLWSTGTVNLTSGTLDIATLVLTDTGNTFNMTGGRLVANNIQGSIDIFGGTLAPGDSAGLTTVTADYAQQAAATLEIEIGGLVAGDEHDLLSVTGSATLGGELQLIIIDNFVPDASDTFTILGASNIVGLFTNVANGQRLDSVIGVGSFIVNYGMGSVFAPNEVVLSNFLAVSIAGDFNGDGVVDAADYTVWRDNLGAASESTIAGNGDGLNGVDIGDYALWRTNFGATAGAATSLHASVPEPASILVIVAFLGAFAGNRRFPISRPAARTIRKVTSEPIG